MLQSGMLHARLQQSASNLRKTARTRVRSLAFGFACSALGLALSEAPARAQARLPPRVSVLTMSPGDQAFARFGHNAILLEWPTRGETRVYNFGTFAFQGMQGVSDFMAGRFRYWLSVST